MRKKAFFITIVALLIIQCSRKLPENIVATVNGEPISLSDFEESYAQLILYGDKFDSYESRIKHLNNIIDLYLLAQYGLEKKLSNESELKTYLGRIKRIKTREIFLRKKIYSNLQEPDDSTLRKIFYFTTQRVHVKHIFAKTKEEIDSLYSLIKAGIPFDTVAFHAFVDTALKRTGGDLGWCKWGELEPNLEDIAFEIKPGRVSRPIKSRFGWHIIKVVNKTYNPIVTEDDYRVRKRELKERFLNRERNKSYFQFLDKFMKGKKALIHNPEWTIVAKNVKRKLREVNQNQLMFIRHTPEITVDDKDLKEIMDNVIISFDDGFWTVREFIERLSEIPLSVTYRSIKEATDLMICNHYIYKEAEKKGYHKSKYVTNALIFNRNLKIGIMVKEYLTRDFSMDSLSVSDSILQEIYNREKDRRFVKEKIFNYSLLIADEQNRNVCDSLLAIGVPFEQLIKQYGRNTLSYSSGIFIGENKIPQGLRNILPKLKDNEISDWMRLTKKVYMKVKRLSIRYSYYPYEEVKELVKSSYIKDLRQNHVNEILKNLHTFSSVKINYPLLKRMWSD